jgi:hypothetical protein
MLENWKSLTAIALMAIVAFMFHTIDINRLEANQRAAIEDQKMADAKQCAAEKQITKEANNALQKDRDDITARLTALKLQHPATCVSVTRSPDVQHRQRRPVGRNGVSSDWLYTYAAEQCSNYWRQLKVCDKFLDDERKIKR